MKWLNNIGSVKILLVVAAVIIALASLVVSHFLTKDLYQEERNKMEVWAEATRSLNVADENTDLNLVLKVINGNNTIPVIVLDDDNEVQTFRNLSLSARTAADTLKEAKDLALKMKQAGQIIPIVIGDSTSSSHIYVCYDESSLLKRISYYPYVQLGVVLIFVVVAIFALLTSKKAEQNKVWVGLSKETAHQLGTPISSLMAWSEILKETYPDDDLIPEMGKDIARLQLIADRFSKIGSLPELKAVCLNDMVSNVVDYMNRRTSRKIEVLADLPTYPIYVKANGQLFEWVIENLCKNAVDAIANGNGKIRVRVLEHEQHVVIDVIDTGKGIRKKDLANVFRPGFTTKKRGWGLGLSLAKRIVESYHRGRIKVLQSEVGVGTTFRIELKR